MTNRAVGLLFQALGLRKRAPKKQTVLDLFFQGRYKISIQIPWPKLLGKDRREVERRCLRFQGFLIGDPTARITMLDTFNEALLQSLSSRHPALKSAYLAAAGPKASVPDLGNWLTHPNVANLLPKCSKWLKQIHQARVKGDLAHAKAKKTGKPTRPISFRQADILLRGAQSGWAEMLRVWKTLK